MENMPGRGKGLYNDALDRRIEDLREKRLRRLEAVCWCEWCEKGIYPGERALKDNRFQIVESYICMDCFLESSKKELAEMLGASFEEVF